jgi:hypothetical protein
MATHANIMIVDSNNIVTGIYCHFDGDFSGVGATLLKYYNNLDKVKDLISLGSISYLEKSIECPDGHSFDTPIRGYTVAYHRDRGEDLHQSEGIIERGIIKNIQLEQYNYVYFECDLKWYYLSKSNNLTLLSTSI